MADLSGQDDRGYWRSLAELADTPAFRHFLETEFPAAAPAADGTSEAADEIGGMPRRRFLQLMSASIAMAGLAGCRWPEERIVPFGRRPESYEPGRRTRFASSRELAGVAAGLLVTSFDGRPVKIEGNPDHPASRGAADLMAQATILELYDPDRLQTPRHWISGRHHDSNWEEIATIAREELVANGGRGLAVLAQSTSSPSVLDLRQRLLARAPGTAWFEYDPVTTVAHHEVRAHLQLDAARVIVDLDADLLVSHPTALLNARAFADGRDPRGEMNRLYVLEPGYSSTGAMADHRFAVSAGEVGEVLAAIAAELYLHHHVARIGDPGTLQPFLDHAVHGATARAIAGDLIANRGRGLITAGPRQPTAVHDICRALNDALGNTDRTVVYEELPPERRHTPDSDELRRLASGLRTERFDRLLILDGNPVHDAPADLDFGAAMAMVPLRLHLSLHPNETSALATWQLPAAHLLESWGDCRAFDGTLCAVQPLIAPLYAGRTVSEVLSLLVDETPRSGHEITRQTFARLLAGGEANRTAAPDDAQHDPNATDDPWLQFLHAGFLPGSATKPARSRRRRGGLPAITPPGGGRSRDDLELVITPDHKLHDGRFANNAWLQELPDFMTKLTWDNAAMVSPALANELELEHGDLVDLDFGGRHLELPVYVQPGQAHYSVTAALGYGRTAAGGVGNGVGHDVYKLRTSDTPWGGSGLKLTQSGRRQVLACTQDHHAIDTRGAAERERRVGGLVREADLAEYRQHPDFAIHRGVHHPPLVSMWTERQNDGHRWGMAIDLNRCIGCNACVVACQAENNIPVVGKEQVAKGREMHWLRLDRYFHGEPDAPRVAHQPLACVHCELAPCEQVCPVAATLHSDEGLNVMVYNRCVGTRYCSNNCPYKVRRFNFFNYQKELQEVEKLAFNPDVTVRARGVMEKCSYCVQRIESARITARNEDRPIADGDIVPACAQTCPADAIVFGDLNDRESRVARLLADQRAYAILGELNIKPRTSYLARIRHLNPELAPAATGAADEHGH